MFGAALARETAGRGWDVTLVDPEPPGHPAASSGGETRLLRCAHGSDVLHARSARRAREIWRDLGDGLLQECGLAWFAHGGSGWETRSEAVLAAEGIACERLAPDEAARLYPSLATGDLAWVLLEPEAGVLFAARATAALAAAAAEGGARLVRGRARPAGEAVDVEGAGRLEGDAVVWACGPWLPALFPGLVRIRVTRQDVPYFEAGPEWHGAPAWVDYDLAAHGTGDVTGAGRVKVASDAEGPAFDPESDPREPAPDATDRAREYLARRFPALAGAAAAGVDVCQYELTPDTRFIAAPHPEHPTVWIYGGGSGHGFKHGPALAERMADWLSGEAPDPALGLGPRQADLRLRTAGLRADGGAAERS